MQLFNSPSVVITTIKIVNGFILDPESLLLFWFDIQTHLRSISAPLHLLEISHIFFLLSELNKFDSLTHNISDMLLKGNVQSGSRANPCHSSFQHTLPSCPALSSSSSSSLSGNRIFPADGAVLKRMTAQNAQLRFAAIRLFVICFHSGVIWFVDESHIRTVEVLELELDSTDC